MSFIRALTIQLTGNVHFSERYPSTINPTQKPRSVPCAASAKFTMMARSSYISWTLTSCKRGTKSAPITIKQRSTSSTPWMLCVHRARSVIAISLTRAPNPNTQRSIVQAIYGDVESEMTSTPPTREQTLSRLRSTGH